MTDDPKKPGTRQAEEVILGKKFQSEQFVTVKSAADVEAEAEQQRQYEHEHAVPINAYFNIRGHHEHHLQAMMLAFTKVRKATVEAFDELFYTFFHSEPKEKPKADANAAAPKADAPKAEPDKEV